MAKDSNPQSQMADFMSYLRDLPLNVPGAAQMADFQRETLQSLLRANLAMTEGAQEIAQRQTAMMRRAAEVMREASRNMTESLSPEEATERQLDLARRVFDETVTALRELSDAATRSNRAVLAEVERRFDDSLHRVMEAGDGAPGPGAAPAAAAKPKAARKPAAKASATARPAAAKTRAAKPKTPAAGKRTSRPKPKKTGPA